MKIDFYLSQHSLHGLSSNPSSTPSAQGRSEEPKVGGGGGSIAFADNISVAN